MDGHVSFGCHGFLGFPRFAARGYPALCMTRGVQVLKPERWRTITSQWIGRGVAVETKSVI